MGPPAGAVTGYREVPAARAKNRLFVPFVTSAFRLARAAKST
jgi:hypothetical protein